MTIYDIIAGLSPGIPNLTIAIVWRLSNVCKEISAMGLFLHQNGPASPNLKMYLFEDFQISQRNFVHEISARDRSQIIKFNDAIVGDLPISTDFLQRIFGHEILTARDRPRHRLQI